MQANKQGFTFFNVMDEQTRDIAKYMNRQHQCVKHIQARIPEAAYNWLQTQAQTEGVSVSKLVCFMIEDAIAMSEAPPNLSPSGD